MNRQSLPDRMVDRLHDALRAACRALPDADLVHLIMVASSDDPRTREQVEHAGRLLVQAAQDVRRERRRA